MSEEKVSGEKTNEENVTETLEEDDSKEESCEEVSNVSMEVSKEEKEAIECLKKLGISEEIVNCKSSKRCSIQYYGYFSYHDPSYHFR